MKSLTNFVKAIIVLSCICFSESSTIREKPVYKCALDGSTCTFDNIFLNTTHYEWQPASDNPNAVWYIQFRRSSIPVITKELCEFFPNLRYLYLEKLNIEEVKQDAFDACLELNFLALTNNKIKSFHPYTFKNVQKLFELEIDNNHISKLPNGLFSNASSLAYLLIEENNLTEFSPEIVRNAENLDGLYLRSNDLSDIDVEKIVADLPGLKKFYLDDNEISCTRTVEIYNKFRSQNILFGPGYNLKTRYYPQTLLFGGLKCNPDISWMASNYRKQNMAIGKRYEDKQYTHNFLSELKEKVSSNGEKMSALDSRLKSIEEQLTKIGVLEKEMRKLFALIYQLKEGEHIK